MFHIRKLSIAKRTGLILVWAAIISLLIATVPATQIAAAPSLILDQTTGPAGIVVTASGNGFSATATWASITFGSTVPFTQQVNAPQTVAVTGGNFSAKFVVPNFPRNTYTVTATSNAAND